MTSTEGPGRLTRIIATIGPACADMGSIHDLIRAGMNIARLNLSHGTPEDHRDVFTRIRLAARESGRQIGILIDIPGPKLRLRSPSGQALTLRTGDQIILSSTPGTGEVGIEPAEYIPEVRPDDIILLGDGVITLKVITGRETISAVVTAGGTVRDGAGVVIPGRRPAIPYADDHLVSNLRFAAGLEPDFLALSFVSSPRDLEDARELLGTAGDIPLIAKIETGAAVSRLEEILGAADGIMIARGDLGVELPIAQVPHVQKRLIRCCNQAGKPVITATEMLESMVEKSRPTRAEVTDVANAIADGTDGTMLSAETSIGKYPATAVRMMAEIAGETERQLPYRRILREALKWREETPEGIIGYSACSLAHELESRAIVAFTRSGITAERVSRCRPGTPIIAMTPDEQIARRLLIRRGVIPCIHQPIHTAGELVSESLALASGMDLTRPGDRIVIIAGNFAGVKGTTNMIQFETVP